MLLNFKAKLFLTMALSKEEYDRVQECKNAKEIWDTLKIHHEGTSQVKETKIDIGVRKFELFEMKETETIDAMYGRFTIIMNELHSPDPCSSCEKTEYLFENLFYNCQILEQTCERLINENLELKREKENL